MQSNNDTGSTSNLTARQRELLTGARDSIARSPTMFDQQNFMTGPDEEIPLPVEGHIVTSDPECMKELKPELERIYNDHDYQNHRGGLGCAEAAGHEMSEIAERALDCKQFPLLFRCLWPTEWFRAVGYEPEGNGHEFVPHAPAAVAVLDGILDGRIRGAV